MKLYAINLNYGIDVGETVSNLTTFKYDAETKQFVEKGQEGNYIKNDLVCILTETQQELLEVVGQRMGITGPDVEIQILDVVDLDTITKGRVVFQGEYDINKAELQDLLDDATDLLVEAEVL